MANGDDRSLGQRLRASLEAAQRTIEVKAVLLGPGQSNPEYPKRDRIRQHIEAECPDDRVILPEEEITEDLEAEFGLGPAEAHLVQMCDLVIALLPPDLNSPSLFQELIDFAGIPGIPARVTIFRPEGNPDAWLGYRTKRILDLYDIRSFIDYPPETWQTCEYIRPQASELVKRERYRRLNRQFFGQ